MATTCLVSFRLRCLKAALSSRTVRVSPKTKTCVYDYDEIKIPRAAAAATIAISMGMSLAYWRMWRSSRL